MSQSVLWSGASTRTVPVSPPTSSQSTSPSVGSWLLVGVFAALVGFGSAYYVKHGLPWPTEPSSSGVALGRAFAPVLASTLADGFDKAADLVAQGKTVQEADEALKATFLQAREKAFQDKVSPAFNALVPPNTEPKDDATRKAYVSLFREFSSGLRRGQ